MKYIDTERKRKIDLFKNNEELMCSLTDRQTEVVELLFEGLTNKEIATKLGVSDRFVRKSLRTSSIKIENLLERQKQRLMPQVPENHTIKGVSTYSNGQWVKTCLLYTSPSPRDRQKSRMPSSA